MNKPAATTTEGLVIASFGARLLVENDHGEVITCHGKKKFGRLVPGDRVGFRTASNNDCTVSELKERQTILARPDMNGRKKLIAANIDQMFIITAPVPSFSTGLVDRYLITAETLHITPIILFNKIDTLSDNELADYEKKLDVYRDIGYQVILTSCRQRHGLDALLRQLDQHLSIFVGQSGVGKSSLINEILPDVQARVGDISEATNKGKHTTTTAWLYHLTNGSGSVIDSPGIREFGLWESSPQQVAEGFREFRPFAEQCRFRDCLHTNEPACGVKQAVKEGKISAVRYDSYLRILQSLEEV